MSKKQVILNYIYSSLYQLLLIIVPFITAPYLSRTLQEEAMGINSYVSAVVQVFSLLGLIGLNTYSMREVAYVRDNKEKLSLRFSELFILRIFLFVLTSIVYVIFALYRSEYTIYFYAYIFSILSSFIDISWLFQGLEEFKVTVTRNFIVKILNVISIFIFIKSADDLILFMFISCIYSLLGNIILFKGVKQRIGHFTFKGLNMRQHLIPSIKLFLPQIATLVYLQVDKIMIESLFSDVAFVGFYDQAERIVKMPLALITALSAVMTPRVSNEFRNNNQEQVEKYIMISFRFSLMLAVPLLFGIIAIAPTMIPWFLDEGFAPVADIMMILSPIILFISMSSVTGTQYLTAVNKTNILTISCSAGAIINIFINFLLIPKYGAFGAACGTVAAEFTTFIIQICSMGNVIKVKDLLKQSVKYFISGIIMYVICYFIGTYFGVSIISTLLQILVGVFTYFVVLMILRDEFAHSNLMKGVAMFKSKFKQG